MIERVGVDAAVRLERHEEQAAGVVRILGRVVRVARVLVEEAVRREVRVRHQRDALEAEVRADAREVRR